MLRMKGGEKFHGIAASIELTSKGVKFSEQTLQFFYFAGGQRAAEVGRLATLMLTPYCTYEIKVGIPN